MINQDRDNDKNEIQRTKKMIEAMDTYYKIKNQYSEMNNKIKKKIMDTKLSWREKRREYSKIVPKCVKCKKSGGTIFKISYDKENGRTATALCNHKENPCGLDIIIQLGMVQRLDKLESVDKIELDEIKKKIVRDKNDLIFGYITTEQAIQQFDEVKEELKLFTDTYESDLEKYIQIVNNKKINYEMNDTRELALFLGMMDYFRKGVPDLDDLTMMLTENSMMDIRSMYNNVEPLKWDKDTTRALARIQESLNRIPKKDVVLLLKREINDIIMQIRKYIREFDVTQNTRFVLDVVEMYVNELQPKIYYLNKLLHSYRNVEFNESNETFHLMDIPNNVSDFEVNFLAEGVKKFDLGRGENTNNNKKTKDKMKKKPLILSETEDSEDSEDSEEETEDLEETEDS